MRYLLFFFLAVSFCFTSPHLVHAEEMTGEVRASITTIIEQKQNTDGAYAVFHAKDKGGHDYFVDTRKGYTGDLQFTLHEGQHILLQIIPDPEGGESQIFLQDVIRSPALLWIFILFVIVIIAVGGKRGLRALIGLGTTMAILFAFIFPQILGGGNAVVITIIAGIAIHLVNLHLTHGFNRQTFLAFGSIVIGIGLAWGFGSLFVHLANLSGLASEESALLFFKNSPIKSPQGILLAGILLGAIGVLDDIAITQTEVVSELLKTDPTLSKKSLFKKAIHIGQHHIASIINTLVLAYAGAAMPLFLLFFVSNHIDIWRFLNDEAVAEEIVRTLAGTMALVLLVPISTWLAVIEHKKTKKKDNKVENFPSHIHNH